MAKLSIVHPEGLEVLQLGLHQELNLCLVSDYETLLGKVVLRVLQKLSERDAETPRVRTVSLESLYEDAGDLLLHGLVNVIEHVDHHPRVEVGMRVDVPELIHYGVKEAEAGLTGQDQNDLLEHLVALLLCLL